MSSAKGPGGSNNKNGSAKDGTIAKAAGTVIVTGIAWSFFKSLSFKKQESEVIEESPGSSFGQEFTPDSIGTAIKDIELDVKEKAVEIKTTVETQSKENTYKAEEFGSEVVQKADAAYSEGKKKAKKAFWRFKSTETYEIVKGDTLYGISLKNGISVEALKAANGLSGDNILAGDKLVIPK